LDRGFLVERGYRNTRDRCWSIYNAFNSSGHAEKDTIVAQQELNNAQKEVKNALKEY
jgi:hypothetical protein